MRYLVAFLLLIIFNTIASNILFHNELNITTATIVLAIASIGGMVYERVRTSIWKNT